MSPFPASISRFLLGLALCFVHVTAKRLHQKAGAFKDSHIKAFKGAYCVNLANGKAEAGTNVQVYECHKVDDFLDFRQK